MRKLCAGLGALLFLAPLMSSGADAPAPDWTQWRGPQRNGISPETGLLKEWPQDGPKLLWDSRKVNGKQSVGTGYSSLAIAGGKIFTLGDHRGDAGYLFCLDEAT